MILESDTLISPVIMGLSCSLEHIFLGISVVLHEPEVCFFFVLLVGFGFLVVVLLLSVTTGLDRDVFNNHFT